MAEHGSKEPEAESGGEASARIDTSGPAVAVALGRATHSSEINAKAAAFLEKQGRLVDLQMEHLHEERELQHRHGRLKYFGERLKIGLQLLTMAVGLIVATGLGAMVWEAHNATGLVVEAFSVPPDLATRGLTGQVVATQLLDKLAAFQAQTRSVRSEVKSQNDWEAGLKVEIPETGVSFGELNRYLRERLGHETRLTGEVFHSGAGLTVTTRVADDAGAPQSGPEADLDKLLQGAAETIFKQTQPLSYVTYLANNGRVAEAVALDHVLAEGPPGPDAAAAKLNLARPTFAAGDAAGAMALADEGLAMAPDDDLVIELYRGLSLSMGRDEARLTMANRGVALLRKHAGKLLPEYVAYEAPNLGTELTELHGDFLAGERGEVEAALHSRSLRWGDPAANLEWQAFDRAMLHDARGADQILAKSAVNLKDRPSWLRMQLFARVAMGHWADAIQTGTDLQEALNDRQAIDAGYTGWGNNHDFNQQVFNRRPAALIAYARAANGDIAGGEAQIAPTALDCYQCVLMRGGIAALKGDDATAAHWYAQTLKLGPSQPFAETDWGRMLLVRGQIAAAIAKFTTANKKGPNFADPLEGWGEALLKQGDAKSAALKFKAADKFAPKWGRNHLMWGQALTKQGKSAEARAQLAAAAGMDLTADEKAELARAMTPVRG